MRASQLVKTTALLFLVALGSITITATLFRDIRWEPVGAVGLTAGFVSTVLAIWVHGKIWAGVVIGLAVIAAILAGPPVGFILVTFLAMGLGGITPLLVSGSEPGMEGVGLQVLLLLGGAALASMAFASQAWAILRARSAWDKSLD